MSFWNSFRTGWALSLRAWPLVAILYFVELAASIVLALPLLAALFRIFGHSTMGAELANPLVIDILSELGQYPAQLPGLGASLVSALVALALLALAAALHGGAMDVLANAEGDFTWPRFLQGIRRFGWRFLALLLFLIPGGLAVLVLSAVAPLALVVLGGTIITESGVYAIAAAGAVGILGLVLLSATMDFARASLVSAPEVRLTRHVGRSIRFMVGHSPPALALVVSFAILSLVVNASIVLSHQLTPLGAAIWMGLAAKQIGAFARWWLRVAAWGAMITLFRSR